MKVEDVKQELLSILDNSESKDKVKGKNKSKENNKNSKNNKKLSKDVFDFETFLNEDNQGVAYKELDYNSENEDTLYAILFEDENPSDTKVAKKIKKSATSKENKQDQFIFEWEQKSSTPSDLELDDLWLGYETLDDDATIRGNEIEYDPTSEKRKLKGVRDLVDQIEQYIEEMTPILGNGIAGSKNRGGFLSQRSSKYNNKSKNGKTETVLNNSKNDLVLDGNTHKLIKLNTKRGILNAWATPTSVVCRNFYPKDKKDKKLK